MSEEIASFPILQNEKEDNKIEEIKQEIKEEKEEDNKIKEKEKEKFNETEILIAKKEKEEKIHLYEIERIRKQFNPNKI